VKNQPAAIIFEPKLQGSYLRVEHALHYRNFTEQLLIYIETEVWRRHGCRVARFLNTVTGEIVSIERREFPHYFRRVPE